MGAPNRLVLDTIQLIPILTDCRNIARRAARARSSGVPTMARFLFYVSPAVGHTLPIVPGLLELQARGHAVHVRGMPSLVPVLQAAGIDASPADERITEVPVTDF